MQKRSREAWQQVIQQWLASGESAAQWCYHHQVSYQSFCRWRRKLEPDSSPRFVELSDSSSGIGLTVEGIAFQLSKNFDEETFLRCLTALRKLPC